MKKIQQIKKLSKQGMKPREIASLLGTTRQYVYTVRSEMKKKAAKMKPVKVVELSFFDKLKLKVASWIKPTSITR